MSKDKLETLLTLAKTFPTSAGVYQMFDENQKIIYIGKAKNLRSRVKSYFQGNDTRYQVQFLINKVEKIETIVTQTEEQALILERDLINKVKPKYNIRLKDDKNYLNIKINEGHEWPRLELVRYVEQDGASYFGPFSSGYEVKQLLDLINKTLLLRTCSNMVFHNRQRPCIEYQIKRCSGPCCLKVSREEYLEWIKQAKSILNGNIEEIVSDLKNKMQLASEEMLYEKAADLRDKIDLLKDYKEKKKYVSSGTEDQDVFALYREESLAVVEVLNVRNARVVNSKSYHFSEVYISNSDILQTVLEQYYSKEREVPEEILLSEEIIDADLLKRSISKKNLVKITIPKIGIKARLLDLAKLNAKHGFDVEFNSEERNSDIIKELATLCKLKQMPRRIECIDISNIQGSDIVGAVVSFIDGKPDKKNYKKYKISQQGKPDDFASMYEVVTRRVQKGIVNDDLPDLIVIDGGKQQLEKALEAVFNLNVDIDIIALAKARKASKSTGAQKQERIFTLGAEKAILLSATKPITKFLERVRDEAHRFVITFHRNTRSKRIIKSELDDIAGIGIERKTRLLRKYKSVSNLKKISAEEIAKTAKMPLSLAKKLLNIIS